VTCKCVVVRTRLHVWQLTTPQHSKQMHHSCFGFAAGSSSTQPPQQVHH
jgi:hypothetical protein